MRFNTLLILAALALPASAAPDTGPTSVNAFDTAAVLAGDCRIVIMGDSFAYTTYRRVFCGFMNFWDHSQLTALYVPAGTRSQMGNGTPLASVWTEVAAESGSGYEVLTPTGSPEFLTLPFGGLFEFQGSPGLVLGLNDGLVDYAVRNSILKATPLGRMFATDDDVRFRGLFWAPPNPALMHDGLALAVGGVTLDQFDPAQRARQYLHLGESPDGLGRPAVAGHVNAFARDVEFKILRGNSQGVVTLRSSTGPIADGRYVHPAGGVYSKLEALGGPRAPGLYYSALADSSWSYSGFGADTAPAFPLDKVFTESQFTHWLDVTTLDQSQPVVFIYYLAAEPDNLGDADVKIEAMIDQAASAAAAVGISRVRHLLVMPHFHRIIGMSDLATTRARFESQRDAMFEIAGRRAAVSAVSIYDATDGVLFDGSTEARDWLRANAPAPFEYANNSVDLADGLMLGDLLDSSDLHPASTEAAAFYSKAFVDALLEPFELDFNGDLILDLGDILGFIQAFLAGDPAADMNGDSFLDTGDITGFISRYLDEI